MNAAFPALLLNIAGMASWLLLTAVLIWREFISGRERGTGSVLGRLAVVVLAFLPWAILAVQQDATTVFANGFRNWAAASVDPQATRDWQGGLKLPATAASAPFWWPTKEHEIRLGVSVSRDLLPAALAELRANEVRVLPDEGAVLLAWEGGRAGWVRFVLVGGPTTKPPAEFREEHVRWHLAKPGVLVGVAEHH